MRIKPLILNMAAPSLKARGFELHRMNPEYVFIKQDDSQVITFDKEKYLPNKLRIHFQVSHPIFFSFYFSYLEPRFCPCVSQIYNTQDEFKSYLEKVLCAITEIVLPYMDEMSKNAVFETYEMYYELSLNTQVRAQRFLHKRNFDMNPKNRDNLLKLDSVIQELQTDAPHRHADFIYNQEEIIDMAAYFGTLNAISSGAHPFQSWYWREINPGTSVYVSGNNGYDPLSRILAAWNFGQEISNYALKKFPM